MVSGEQSTLSASNVAPARPGRRPWVRWFTWPLHWCWLAVRSLLQLLLIAWATLAIYYSNLPWPWLRLEWAIAFAIFATWSLWIARRRRPRMRWAFAGAS
jgi:hypothetical protein